MATCVKCPAPLLEGNESHCVEHYAEFKDKLVSWRKRANNMFQYPWGQDAFHNTTDRTEAVAIRENFKRGHGYYPEPVGTRWV